MKIIGIIGAMDEEIEVLKNYIENLKFLRIKNFSFFTGTIWNHKIILCKSGIGKVNATISTTLLIENFAPDLILNTGSAGAISQNLNIWDIVIGEKIFHHDADATAFGHEKWQIPQMQKNFLSNKNLIKISEKIIQNFENFSVFRGEIASGDQFVSSQNQKKFLQENFPSLLAVEMESAAIAQTATILEVPFLIIRSISDKADNSAEISFDEFLKIASQNSAKIILEILKKL